MSSRVESFRARPRQTVMQHMNSQCTLFNERRAQTPNNDRGNGGLMHTRVTGATSTSQGHQEQRQQRRSVGETPHQLGKEQEFNTDVETTAWQCQTSEHTTRRHETKHRATITDTPSKQDSQQGMRGRCSLTKRPTDETVFLNCSEFTESNTDTNLRQPRATSNKSESGSVKALRTTYPRDVRAVSSICSEDAWRTQQQRDQRDACTPTLSKTQKRAGTSNQQHGSGPSHES